MLQETTRIWDLAALEIARILEGCTCQTLGEQIALGQRAGEEMEAIYAFCNR